MTAFVETLPRERKRISILASLEVRSAIHRRALSGAIEGGSKFALRQLEEELPAFRQHPLEQHLITHAEALISRSRLKTLDALQLASALEVSQSELQPILFVSCDLFLLQAAHAEGLDIWNPALEDYP